MSSKCNYIDKGHLKRRHCKQNVHKQEFIDGDGERQKIPIHEETITHYDFYDESKSIYTEPFNFPIRSL